jgi:hypothetical protein
MFINGGLHWWVALDGKNGVGVILAMVLGGPWSLLLSYFSAINGGLHWRVAHVNHVTVVTFFWRC